MSFSELVLETLCLHMLRNVLLKWTFLNMGPLLLYAPPPIKTPCSFVISEHCFKYVFWGVISLHIDIFHLQLCLFWLYIHQDVDPLHWGFILSRRRSPDLSLPTQMRDPDFPSREVQGHRELHHASPLTDRTWNWEWGKMMSYCKNLKLASSQLNTDIFFTQNWKNEEISEVFSQNGWEY